MRPATLDKYLYIERTPTWLVRSVYGLGILTWLAVIYGYFQFLKLNPLFFAIIAPVLVFLIIYHLLSYAINLFYKKFDLKAHGRLVRRYDFSATTASEKCPSIDVFLPICGEDASILVRTFLAVSQLDYVKEKIQVYVLDDKGVEKHRELANEFGFTYFSREDKGYMKKSGNIKYGYERSSGEFIIIFDADFAPHPDFIRELLPYLLESPQTAIVQSPQYFQTDEEVHKRSALEYGAAYVQEDFYRIIQPARDQLGAPICCGSNAIYRRAALDNVGGTYQIEHSEDMYTGFELNKAGWQIRYVPIILAVGLCPDGLHSYFHQQHRWCSGSLSLMLEKKFWGPGLSFSQKICFISGYMYYLSHPLTILLSFQAFFLLFLYHNSISLWNSLPFIPCILFSLLIIPYFRITKQRYGGFLARNAYAYSYSHASVVALLKVSVGWQPTNTKNTRVSREFLQQTLFVALYFALYVTLIGIAIGKGVFKIFDLNYYSLLFWIFYTIVSTSLVLSQLYLVLDDVKESQLGTSTDGLGSLVLWRLQTVGGYLLMLVLSFYDAFSIALRY